MSYGKNDAVKRSCVNDGEDVNLAIFPQEYGRKGEDGAGKNKSDWGDVG